MFAAGNGCLECVKILTPLEKGMKDNYGCTAKYYATAKCAEFLAQFPEESVDQSNESGENQCVCSNDLFEAAKKGCEACCRRLID